MEKNNAQEEIIHTVNGQLLVVACPGSGKTTTLLRRIHYMINEAKIPAQQILSMNIGCFRICRLITDLQISIWIIKAVMREEICHGFLIILTDIYSDTTILFMV